MSADKVPIARQHAAKVLRPGAVNVKVQDYVPDFSGAQLLWLRRRAQERVDLSVDKELHWSNGRTQDPFDIPDGVEAHVGCHGTQKCVGGSSPSLHAYLLALQVSNAVNVHLGEQFKTSDMHS